MLFGYNFFCEQKVAYIYLKQTGSLYQNSVHC